MGNITQIGKKPDRYGAQLQLHEQFCDEVWTLVQRYQEQGLDDMFIRLAFGDMHFEMQMGPVAFVEDPEPAA